MSRKTLLFFAFLKFCLVHQSAQNLLPVNVLNPLEVGKSPLVTYALNEFNKNRDEKAAIANNSTWAILVAGSAGWDNYRWAEVP